MNASVFTSGIVILEEKTSVNGMSATWINNGVRPQELRAEKTQLLEEQLSFQLLHSLTNLLGESAPHCHRNQRSTLPSYPALSYSESMNYVKITQLLLLLSRLNHKILIDFTVYIILQYILQLQLHSRLFFLILFSQ